MKNSERLRKSGWEVGVSDCFYAFEPPLGSGRYYWSTVLLNDLGAAKTAFEVWCGEVLKDIKGRELKNSEKLKEAGWEVSRRYVINSHGPSRWKFCARCGDLRAQECFDEHTIPKVVDAYELFCGRVLLMNEKLLGESP